MGSSRATVNLPLIYQLNKTVVKRLLFKRPFAIIRLSLRYLHELEGKLYPLKKWVMKIVVYKILIIITCSLNERHLVPVIRPCYLTF